MPSWTVRHFKLCTFCPGPQLNIKCSCRDCTRKVACEHVPTRWEGSSGLRLRRLVNMNLLIFDVTNTRNSAFPYCTSVSDLRSKVIGIQEVTGKSGMQNKITRDTRGRWGAWAPLIFQTSVIFWGRGGVEILKNIAWFYLHARLSGPHPTPPTPPNRETDFSKRKTGQKPERLCPSPRWIQDAAL